MKIKRNLLLAIAVVSFMACAPSRVIKKNQDQTLRIMSYNVHHCNPPSKPGLIDVNAIVKAIRAQSPDLVALQEIDVNTTRSGRLNEAAVIAEKLGMKVYFAKSIDHDGGDYGVAILSRFPISEMTTHKLPTAAGTRGEPRVFATVKVILSTGKQIRFGCTHLDAQRDDINRLIQIREINRLAAQDELPLLIAGDLNARPGSEVINLLDQKFRRTCSDCGFTIPVVDPKSTIDFIACRKTDDFELLSHEVIPENYASDHLPVLAVVRSKSI